MRIDSGGRSVLAEPADEPWVRQALEGLQPTSRPTRVPADLIEQLALRREAISQRLARDLAADDPTDIAPLFDEYLLPQLRPLDALRPPIFYLATPRDRLKDLVKGGWDDPRFHYNRAADAVSFDKKVSLVTDRPLDDTVMPALFQPDDATEARAKALVETIQDVESDLANAISTRSLFVVQAGMVSFLGERVFRPMQLRDDQAWLGLGVTTVLAAKYASQVTGLSAESIIEGVLREHPRSPVKAASIDLLHPVDPAALRTELLPVYVDAMRRKATVVVRDWVAQSGEDAIPKVLAAVRTTRPADGAALAQLVKDTTGADLTAALGTK